MKKKKQKSGMSFFDIMMALITGGKHGFKKNIKNNPDMQQDIENVKGMVQKGLQDLKDIEKKFNIK